MSLSAAAHNHPMPETVGVPIDSEYEKKLRSRIRDLLQYKHDGFPGCQPVSFEASHFAYLEDEDYYVCEKSDGIRYIMFAELSPKGPATFLLDRKNKIWYVSELRLPTKDGKFHHETMMDGELVCDVDGDVKKLRFLVFDLMVLNGKSQVHRSFSSRLGTFREEVLKPLQSRLKKDTSRRQKFSVEIKEMERSYGLNKVFQMMPSLKHGHDGLVFTPVKSAYVAGTDKKLLKWKPPNLNTVDFKINVKWTKERKPLYELFIAANGVHKYHDALTLDDETFAEWRRDPPNGRIGEFWWDPHWHTLKHEEGFVPTPHAGGWRFKRFRNDKDTANDESVLEKIKHSIADNVTQEMLEKSCEKIRKQWKIREQKMQEAQQKGDRIQIPPPLPGPLSAQAGAKHIPPTPSTAGLPQISPTSDASLGNSYFPSNDRRDQAKREDLAVADVIASSQASGQRIGGNDRRTSQDAGTSHKDTRIDGNAPSSATVKSSPFAASSDVPTSRVHDELKVDEQKTHEQQTSGDDASQHVHQTRSRRTSQASSTSGHSLQGRSRRPSQETRSPQEEYTAEDAPDGRTAPEQHVSDVIRTRADLQSASFRRPSADSAQVTVEPGTPVENLSADVHKPQSHWTPSTRRTTEDDHRLTHGLQTPPASSTSEATSQPMPDRRYSRSSYQAQICQTPERRSSADEHQGIAPEQAPSLRALEEGYRNNVPRAPVPNVSGDAYQLQQSFERRSSVGAYQGLSRPSGDGYQEAEQQTSQRRLSGSHVQQMPAGRPSDDEQVPHVARTPSRRPSGETMLPQDVQQAPVRRTSDSVPDGHENTYTSRRLSSPITPQSSYQPDARQRLPSIDEVYHPDTAIEEPMSRVRSSLAVSEDVGRDASELPPTPLISHPVAETDIEEQKHPPSTAFPHGGLTPSASSQQRHSPYAPHLESNAQPTSPFLLGSPATGPDMQAGTEARGQLYQSRPMNLPTAEPQNGQMTLEAIGDDRAMPQQQHIFINYSNNLLSGLQQGQSKPQSYALDALATVAAMDAPQLTQLERQDQQQQQQEQRQLYPSSPPPMMPSYTQQFSVAPYSQSSSSSSSPPPQSSGRPALPQKRKSKATLDFILNDPAPPSESESKRGRMD